MRMSALACSIGNPYLNEFRKLYTADPGSHEPGFYDRGWRNLLTAQYAWAIPNAAALECLAQHGPIVEIGAGGGYWAMLVRQMGVDVLAIDNRSTHQEETIHYWCEVEHGGAERAAEYSYRTLFLCWPPYDNDAAEVAVRCYRGSTVIYVGEQHGCTGTGELEDLLAAEWDEVQQVAIPQWPFIHDYLRVLRRKATR